MSTQMLLTELRQGSAADLALVAEIMVQAFDPRYGEAWTQSQCLGMLSLPGVWLTLAHVDGRVAGFALAREGAGEAELLLLATHPDLRGRGVGAALLRSVIADVRTRGAGRIYLEVRAGNEAIRLYRREGFAKIGERRSYYRGKGGQLYDAITLARDLA